MNNINFLVSISLDNNIVQRVQHEQTYHIVSAQQNSVQEKKWHSKTCSLCWESIRISKCLFGQLWTSATIHSKNMERAQQLDSPLLCPWQPVCHHPNRQCQTWKCGIMIHEKVEKIWQTEQKSGDSAFLALQESCLMKLLNITMHLTCSFTIHEIFAFSIAP